MKLKAAQTISVVAGVMIEPGEIFELPDDSDGRREADRLLVAGIAVRPGEHVPEPFQDAVVGPARKKEPGKKLGPNEGEKIDPGAETDGKGAAKTPETGKGGAK